MSVLTPLIQAIFARLYAIKPEGKWGKEKGASALEYIVLVAVIVLVIVVSISFLSEGGLATFFEPISDAIENAPSTPSGT